MIDLAPQAIAKLSTFAQAALPLETGGILLGWYEHDDIHVADVVVVDDPSATATSYRRGREEGNMALATYMKSGPVDSPIGYVGEWHSHPGPSGPSPLDTSSFIAITGTAKRPLAQVVMTLHGHEWRPIVCMSRFNSRFRGRRSR